MHFLHAQPTAKNLSILFLAAFLIRAATFFFYVQHNERYHQADSADYHSCAFLLAYSNSMIRFDNNEPIFWRTPGYPIYLLPFYMFNGITTPEFSNYEWAHKASIWLQIFLCSFIPIILFYLALSLTSHLMLAWLVAWISVFHIGFVLATTYLLTDALASIFFYLFLLFYYQSWKMYGQTYASPNPASKYKRIISPFVLPVRHSLGDGGSLSNRQVAHSLNHWNVMVGKETNTYKSLLASVLFLSLFTWMRPMGIFIAIFSGIFLVISHDTVINKIKKILLFLTTFFITVLPWYIRNYFLTGKFFFCPMFGGVLQAFCAPKIVRRVTGYPIRDCLKALFVQVKQQTAIQEQLYKEQMCDWHVVQHQLCEEVAWPWVAQFPGYALYDWIEQVIKTTFDLYSYQLVTFATNTYTFDPIEEFLNEKIAACLYAIPLPWWMRTLSWIELFFYLFIWVGFFIGIWKFIIKPLYELCRENVHLNDLNFLWLKTVPMIGAALIMTGGYGYARLRIPVEPLIIILALSYWLYNNKKTEVA